MTSTEIEDRIEQLERETESYNELANGLPEHIKWPVLDQMIKDGEADYEKNLQELENLKSQIQKL